MSTLIGIAAAYCEQHPEARGGVEAAYLAYRAGPEHPDGHHFGDHAGDPGYRHRPCLWCGRTRWDVRHSDADPRCTGRPDIAAVVRAEEERAFALLGRAPRIVAAHVPDPEALTGEMLAWLHHTHGLDPSTVEAALGSTLDEALHEAYADAMDEHRAATSAGAHKASITP